MTNRISTEFKTEFSPWSDTIRLQKYAHELEGGVKETWGQLAHRVPTHVFAAVNAEQGLVDAVQEAIYQRKFIPGGRYLYATGKPLHQTQNCLLCKAEDSREGWAQHLHNHAMGLMTGAGMGTVYSDVREEGALIKGMGGIATGPLSLMQMTNEAGRGIQQGGSRRAALWAGLHWWHPDVFKFIVMKDWPEHIKAAKAKDYNAYAPMDMTNISVILDTEFFQAYDDPRHKRHKLAHDVYWAVIRNMLETGEPGFSVDCGVNEGENLRNACTEITSYDDSDICNIGSINMARVTSLDEMAHLVEIGTAFLLSGTEYSHVPYDKVGEIRVKNRRLGLGLMGIHEWLLLRGKKYGPDPELHNYLAMYTYSTTYAKNYAEKWNLSVPVKTRAIAPTGSIGILAETTTGIEPVFCVAYKRRYLDGITWKYQYVVDPTAQSLIDRGVKPHAIEDAYDLAHDVERRVEFQAWVQQFVDHGISSTINLPEWGSELNNESKVEEFGNMLMKYLPKVRGITVYPDGARSGQPLNPVKYATAVQHWGQVFYEQADICEITSGGTCGS